MVCNLIIRNMKEKFTIDGIQFETPNGCCFFKTNKCLVH